MTSRRCMPAVLWKKSFDLSLSTSRQERTMTELCERFEITRQTGYVWLRRYREAGAAGLGSRAAPRTAIPTRCRRRSEQQVLGLRQAHMRWGPRKLKHILQRDEPGRSWPAGQHYRSAAAARRLGGSAPEALAHRPLHGAAGACRRTHRVWCADFIRAWVPHR